MGFVSHGNTYERARTGGAPTYSFEEGLLTPREAMELLGYENRAAFLRMVRRAGIPRVPINKRVIRFYRRDLHEWLHRRSIRAA